MWAVKWWSKSWSHLRDHSDLEWGEVNGWKNGGFVWTLCWTSVWKFSSALQATILDITNFTGSSTSSLYRESCYIRTCWSLWRLHQGVESIVRYILNSFLPEFAFFFLFQNILQGIKVSSRSGTVYALSSTKQCKVLWTFRWGDKSKQTKRKNKEMTAKNILQQRDWKNTAKTNDTVRER